MRLESTELPGTRILILARWGRHRHELLIGECVPEHYVRRVVNADLVRATKSLRKS